MNLACQKCLGNLPKVLGIWVTPPHFGKNSQKYRFFKWFPPLEEFVFNWRAILILVLNKTTQNINAFFKMLLLLGVCRLCGNNLKIFRLCGNNLETFRLCGNNLEIFRLCGNNIQIFRLCGNNIEIFRLCGNNLEIFRLCGNNLEIFRRGKKPIAGPLLIRLMLQVWFIRPSTPPEMDQNPTHSELSGSKMGLRLDNIPAPRIILSWFWSDCIIKTSPHHSYEVPWECFRETKIMSDITEIASF